MNFRQTITLSLLFYIILGSVVFAQVVEIPDLNLRAAVRDALNLPGDAPITQADMRRLTKLEPRWQGIQGITNLSGLEFATNLKHLDLAMNPISDLTPLANLFQLRTLWLWQCDITDITPLANLTGLTNLDLSYNRIVDVSQLVNLTSLVELLFNQNRIVDVTPLANLTNLQLLYIENNLIVDISPLANLGRLVELRLSHNRIADINPLADLTNLERLNIAGNLIADHSSLDTLSLSDFIYDEACEMPALPLLDRIENRNYPSVFTFWGHILNRPRLSEIEKRASYDLRCCHDFGLYFHGTLDNLKLAAAGSLKQAIQERDELLSINPDRILIFGINFYVALRSQYPDDWAYWLRDVQGNIVPGWWSEQSPPIPDGKINYTLPAFQDRLVAEAVAVSKCGLFDGIFFDNWAETPLLSPHIDDETEHLARDNIIRRIRAQTRPNFLILANSNARILPRTGPQLNGGFMETIVPGKITDIHIDSHLYEVEHTLQWMVNNLRKPVINALEGEVIPTEPPDSPNNLRWMRAYTTLILTFSDGYVVFSELVGHTHYWYDFWDADLGRPVGPKSQLYDEDIPGLYIREFTNGWAVYNHSAAPQIITLPEEAQGVASELVNTEHTLPNLDGEMYLRVKRANPADVNRDGVVNILDLVVVAQGMGTDTPEADVNGDGVVNVFDLVFVANQF